MGEATSVCEAPCEVLFRHCPLGSSLWGEMDVLVNVIMLLGMKCWEKTDGGGPGYLGNWGEAS